MISSVDSTNLSSAMVTQSDLTALSTQTSTPSTAQGTNVKAVDSNFLPVATQSTSSSITDTLNSLISMLQSLMASISALFGKINNNTGGSVGGVGTPNTSDRYDFLRPVDQEPVTVIPTPSNKSGSVSNTGAVPLDNDPRTIEQSKETPSETTPKKTATPKRTPTPKKTTTPKKSTKSKKPASSKTSTKSSTLKNSNGEFLWKPKSDKDGKLAVLLPKSLTGAVSKVQIVSPDGESIIATGKAAGVGNGDREHFRFNKAGGEFPDGALVEITLEDGSKQTVTIKETNNRTTL